MTWKVGTSIGVPPTSRFGHTATAIGPHLLIFGGWEYSKAQNEIIVLREWSPTNGEEPNENDNLLGEGLNNEQMDSPLIEDEQPINEMIQEEEIPEKEGGLSMFLKEMARKGIHFD